MSHRATALVLAASPRRRVALSDSGELATPASIGLDDLRDFAWLDDRLLVSHDRGVELRNSDGTILARTDASAGTSILVGGGSALLLGLELSVARFDGELEIEPLAGGPHDVIGYIGGHRTIRSTNAAIIVGDPDRAPIATIPTAGTPIAAREILGGGTLAVVCQADRGTILEVVRLRGGVVHRIELPPIDELAIAGAGRALALSDGVLLSLDLRLGRITNRAPAPLELTGFDLDSSGELVGLEEGCVALEDLMRSSTAASEKPAAVSGPASAPRLELVQGGRPRRPTHEIKDGPLEALVSELPPPDPEAEIAHLEALIAGACIRATATAFGDEVEHGDEQAVAALATNLGLSHLAVQLLAAIIAPVVSTEAIRLYVGMVADPSRPHCDRGLLEQLFGAEGLRAKCAIRDELAALSNAGLISGGQGDLFEPLEPAAAIVDRLCGRSIGGALAPGCGLDDLILPPAIVASAVAAASRKNEPLRLVVRGRPGAGGKTLIAALAARAGRLVVAIECDPATLRSELARARIHGAIPCVLEPTGAIAAIVREFDGPVFFRTTSAEPLPIDPGHAEVIIPPTSESHRVVAWTEAAAREGLELTDVEIDHLARRFRVGPGVIFHVAAHAPGDLASLESALRQHVKSRLDGLATPIERLPTWDRVILDEQGEASVRELVARAAHRRLVFEEWNLEPATGRGLAVLFSGPPGTGKTLAAGLVARELGLDLYRVDLSQVASKWIGETEKNLGKIFDAAEDGQAVILFDEADSLFAKRGKVASAVDRHSNMEVNYLLQRLDSFEGIAILTTNLTRSLDRALARRLAMRVEFPFPNEATRLRLWQAHISTDLPAAPDLDLDRLAASYRMTGAYIRNAVVRAAFLAASETSGLTASHLERAVHLEYQDAGHLTPGGRLE